MKKKQADTSASTPMTGSKEYEELLSGVVELLEAGRYQRHGWFTQSLPPATGLSGSAWSTTSKKGIPEPNTEPN
jgi:hypothetical protein